VSVHLVGAGPGQADLLTLRALRLLGRADVVVHDRLVDPAVLSHVRLDAQLIDVGKSVGDLDSQNAINELLVTLGRAHDCVVRLKGGDPFVFGRGGEEMIALREAGLECDVVPGVTSAFSAPLAAGIPVTHRGVSRGVTVVTASAADGESGHLRRLCDPEMTLVVLMGVRQRAMIAHELLAGGLAVETPVAVVERAWTDRQRVVRATLGELGGLDVVAPAVIVVGRAAALDVAAITDAAAGAA
jgi:uroporphyrin-III C-methyltransferase